LQVLFSERQRRRRVPREGDQRLRGEQRPDGDDERGADRDLEQSLGRR
jgi:hypothetical protein